jgi:hypothetical protein
MVIPLLFVHRNILIIALLPEKLVQPQPGAVACTVSPVMWEVEIGGSRSEAGPGQMCETLPKKKTKAKRWGLRV